ncbi:MAG: DUF3800 domain-containing protein [Hoeflea sp.]|uniref:DUF3800 domain-containing protein n=1 Tax=Hoeflea sp. TaxID=1940281 RepID=UPI0027316684|nr:DUF3800 domain-containing protein [Hoeflea sp.]MDP2119654.1 DUF3800 domain-containing protein [Hoeflea sp.]
MNKKISQIALFCDEAGKETDRYLAVGGLVVDSPNAKDVRQEVTKRFRLLGINKEMKWNSTRNGTKDKYHEMAHYFFELVQSKAIRFHCLLVDFQRFDHSLRGDGKNESLKRMYYQLILHRLCKKHGKDCDLYAFPDKANELKGLDDFKANLNKTSRERFSYDRDCLRAIEFRDSEDEPLLQLNDVILGAICYQKNRRFEAEGAGHPKANLAGYIMGSAKLKNLNEDTPWHQDSFSVWNLKSQYLKGGA